MLNALPLSRQPRTRKPLSKEEGAVPKRKAQGRLVRIVAAQDRHRAAPQRQPVQEPTMTSTSSDRFHRFALPSCAALALSGAASAQQWVEQAGAFPGPPIWSEG